MLILQALLVPLIVLILMGLVIVIGCDGLSPRDYDTKRNRLLTWGEGINSTMPADRSLSSPSLPSSVLATPNTYIDLTDLSRLPLVDLEFSTIENLNGE